MDGMKPRVNASDDLLALAHLQGGVLTGWQAAAEGLGRNSVARLVREGTWGRIVPGLFAVQPDAPDWRGLAWGGVLIGGDRARLAGLAAAYLHGLIDQPPDQVLVLIPDEIRRRDRPPWRFRRERAAVRDPRSPGSPPRTTVEDTVLDLCDAGPQVSGESAAHWVTVAVQSHRTTALRLREALHARERCRQRRLVEDLLTDVDLGAHSALELRYLRDVERAHGLPGGERQSARAAARIEGRNRAYRDVLYRAYGLIVELDGRVGHVGSGRLRDLRRDNVSTLRGERTLRYGWQDVTDEPCGTAFQVAGMLVRGGWPGLPSRCRLCRDLPGAVLAELAAV